jgi:hypothetical protein
MLESQGRCDVSDRAPARAQRARRDAVCKIDGHDGRGHGGTVQHKLAHAAKPSARRVVGSEAGAQASLSVIIVLYRHPAPQAYAALILIRGVGSLVQTDCRRWRAGFLQLDDC